MEEYEKERYLRYVKNANEKAVELLENATLLGININTDNKDEIIAGLYTSLITKMYPTSQTFAVSANSWKTQEI